VVRWVRGTPVITIRHGRMRRLEFEILYMDVID
jgi:hypothetical protein